MVSLNLQDKGTRFGGIFAYLAVIIVGLKLTFRIDGTVVSGLVNFI